MELLPVTWPKPVRLSVGQKRQRRLQVSWQLTAAVELEMSLTNQSGQMRLIIYFMQTAAPANKRPCNYHKLFRQHRLLLLPLLMPPRRSINQPQWQLILQFGRPCTGR